MSTPNGLTAEDWQRIAAAKDEALDAIMEHLLGGAS